MEFTRRKFLKRLSLTGLAVPVILSTQKSKAAKTLTSKKHVNARLLVVFKNGNAQGLDVQAFHQEKGYLVVTGKDTPIKFKLSEIDRVGVQFH